LPTFKDDATGNYFSVTAKYDVPKPITLKEDRYWLEFDNNIISGSLGIPDKLVRNFPFALPRGRYHGRYRLNITWPKNLRGNDIPIAKKINNDFFEVAEEFVSRGNLVNYMLDYKVKQEQIDTLELPKLHAKAKELERSLFVKISVPTYFVVSGEAEILPFRDIDTQRLMTWIGLASKEISDKKLETVGIDERCDLALSMLRVRDALPGKLVNLINNLESDFTKDIKKEGVNQCLARIASAKGDFVKSNALFNAKTAPKEGDLLNKELAWVRFYAGDFKGAEETMNRFLAARNSSTEPKSANFDAANEIALRQRLGKAIPVASLVFAHAIPDGIWPRPLLAMQVGAISETDLLARIDTFSPDMRDMALTEAWFFIGQKKLSEKDVSGAKKAFTWVVRNGLRSSINYLQAKAELARLEPSEANFEKAKVAADSGDYSLAKKLYEESAKLGFAAAEYEIGELYYYGRGVKQDYVKSLEWYQRAAQKNYAIALNDIGAAYESGKGVKIDGKEAVSWYLKASEIGSSKADYNVGIRYKEGDFLPQDYAKAFFYFERSAQAGDDSSQYELAKLYEEGLGVKVDVAKAMTWANRAVIAGNTNAQVLVGRFYATGFGVAKDEARAARIFKDAAMKGHRLGQYKLALCYTEGKGVEKDLKVAAEWLTKAADGDYGLAQYELAIRYFRSEGVKFDKYYGVRLLMLATQNNVAAAMYELVNLLDEKTKAFTSAEIKIFVSVLDRLYALEHGKEARPNESILNHYLRKSAQLGNVDAQINLSRKLRGGIGIDKNQVEAISWLEKAAEKGSLVALVDLADSYENGDGVGKDYVKALELYSRAALAGDSLAFLNLAKLHELGEGTRISFSTAYVYNRIGMRLLKNEKPQYSEDDLKTVKLSDAVSKSLRENEKGEADRVADSWKVKDPLPKLAKN
jgi:TPR repeat protein